MLKIIFFIFFIIIFASDVLAQRLLIGFNEGIVLPKRRISDGGSAIRQCKYQNNCSEYNNQHVIKPQISFEFLPKYLFNRFGINFGIITPKEYKLRLLDYPNDEDFIDMKISVSHIYSGISYTIGDKELGKNGGIALILGFMYNKTYRTAEYIYKNEKYSETRYDNIGNSLYYSLEIGKFSYSHRKFTGDHINLFNSRVYEIDIDYNEYSFSYSYYFD